VFEFLKHITPKIKILSLSLILILLPGAIISYLSLKSIQEKAENQRIKYHGTANLVRDKLESELYQIETSFRNNFLDSLMKLESVSDIQIFLQGIQNANPSLKNLTLIGSKGELITGLVSFGLKNIAHDETHLSSKTENIISQAEKKEFIDKDYMEAVRIYRKALPLATSDQQQAILHSRIGRNFFKLQNHEEGIREYQNILELEKESLFIGNTPAHIVALYQMAEGYEKLSAFEDRNRIILELYSSLLHQPWDLKDGSYLYYLNSAKSKVNEIESGSPKNNYEKGPLNELQEIEGRLLLQARNILFIKDRISEEANSDLTQLASSEIKHMSFTEGLDPSLELAYFTVPSAIQKPTLLGLAFQFNEYYLLRELFPDVITTVELGKDIIIGILSERDSLLYLHHNQDVSRYLVAEKFSRYFSTWKVALFDRTGKSIEQLSGREKQLYLVLFIGILAIMLLGIVILARAVIHESEISRMKSEFVANVTHELKTPLSLIRMFGETLDSGIVTEEVKRREFYSIIRKESERLTLLINNVLDFSRIDTDKKDYNFEDADIVPIVKNSLEAYRFHIRDSGFEIESKFTEEAIVIRMDKDAISQAFLNLLSNAVKYSEETKFIHVEVRREEQSVLISVRDKGVGIAREELKKIYSKFYRVPNKMQEQARGSGLGLTLTKHIVDAHKGLIEVQSEPGKGSTFTISLPAKYTQ